MLGWEFPPLVSGGLAIATHGLVKALSTKYAITLIVPKAGAHDLKSEIIGLNQVTLSKLEAERIRQRVTSPNTEYVTVPVSISPYHEVNQSLRSPWDDWYSKQMTLETIHKIFDSSQAYGWDIMQKVNLYTELVSEVARRKSFDVIHAHDWVTFKAAVQIKHQSGAPLVMHVHSLETDRAGAEVRNAIYELERDCLHQADQIAAVSEYTRKQLIEHYGISSDKINVVHNGVESMVAVPRKKKHINDKLVLFLGRITHQKGPYALVETAARVLKKYPRVKFVVAGTGDQFAQTLESAAYKKLGRYFIFTGFLPKDKVEELLSIVDVYFMPSVSEPFGLTALEAAQHGVPSVLSKQSGVAEVLNSTLKADFWDLEKFTETILTLLKYPAYGAAMANQALREVEHLTWNAAAIKIGLIYQRLRT